MTQPRRTFVDKGITYDMITGAVIMMPATPWKARFPRWLKIAGFVALFLAFASIQAGSHPPIWLPILCWPLGIVGVALFFADSFRRHPWAWQYFGKSVAIWTVLLGAKHAWHVHEQHQREAMADAVADAFQQRGL